MTVGQCETLRDRMPILAIDGTQMSEDERLHLDQCSGCAEEWELVQLAAGLGDEVAVRIDPQILAAEVLNRLRREPAEIPARHPGWWAAGLVAAAAMIALVLGPLVRSGSDGAETSVSPVALLVPELDGLETSELILVLSALDGTAADDSEMGMPPVDDLETQELEQVLQAWEG